MVSRRGLQISHHHGHGGRERAARPPNVRVVVTAVCSLFLVFFLGSKWLAHGKRISRVADGIEQVEYTGDLLHGLNTRAIPGEIEAGRATRPPPAAEVESKRILPTIPQQPAKGSAEDEDEGGDFARRALREREREKEAKRRQKAEQEMRRLYGEKAKKKEQVMVHGHMLTEGDIVDTESSRKRAMDKQRLDDKELLDYYSQQGGQPLTSPVRMTNLKSGQAASIRPLVVKGHPFIVGDAMQQWKSMKWTCDWFSDFMDNEEVTGYIKAKPVKVTFGKAAKYSRDGQGIDRWVWFPYASANGSESIRRQISRFYEVPYFLPDTDANKDAVKAHVQFIFQNHSASAFYAPGGCRPQILAQPCGSATITLGLPAAKGKKDVFTPLYSFPLGAGDVLFIPPGMVFDMSGEKSTRCAITMLFQFAEPFPTEFVSKFKSRLSGLPHVARCFGGETHTEAKVETKSKGVVNIVEGPPSGAKGVDKGANEANKSNGVKDSGEKKEVNGDKAAWGAKHGNEVNATKGVNVAKEIPMALEKPTKQTPNADGLKKVTIGKGALPSTATAKDGNRTVAKKATAQQSNEKKDDILEGASAEDE